MNTKMNLQHVAIILSLVAAGLQAYVLMKGAK
jgi:hypothetical protein